MSNDLKTIRDREHQHLKVLVGERERLEAARQEQVRDLVEALRGCIIFGPNDMNINSVDHALKELGI